MDRKVTEAEVQGLVSEYKQKEDWEEKIATANEISAVIQDLAEGLVQHYDGRIGTDELSTLFRLCQVPNRATLSTKQSRVDDLDLPDDVKEEIKSQIPDDGIVGGGQAQIPIPEQYEPDAYDLLEVLVTSEERSELDAAIDEFAALDIDGVQAGVLSPVIFFLHPTKYPVINSASREGMEELFDHEVSPQLSEYTEEAERFRDFRDEYGLGGDGENLRDVDWFFYTLTEDAEPAVWIEETAIHGEYKEPGHGELSLGRAVFSPQRGSSGRDIYATLREARIGDIVVHVLQDEGTIAGVSIVESELITDYDFPDAVEQRWEEPQQEQGGYLRFLTDYHELDNPPHVYEDFLDHPNYKAELDQIYEEHSGLFYDKNRDLVQGGYFTSCPDELTQLFADLSSELETYFQNHGIELSQPDVKQIFQIPLSDSGAMQANFEATVRESVPAEVVEEIVDTDFERATIRVWASGNEDGNEEPGDLLLFADRDTEDYIIAATVADSEVLSEDAAREFSDAVGWEYSDKYRYLIYLDKVYEVNLAADEFWELMDYEGFPKDGFSRVYPTRIEENIIANEAYGSVDAFLEEITEDVLYPHNSGENDGESTPVYYLWNTNYEHENTDGSEAFQREVAAAYGGDQWGSKLARPEKGDILFAYLVGTGVIGAGVVKEETDGEPIDKDDPDIEPIKGPDKLEYHLPVDWLYTLPKDAAIDISETADLLNRKKMSRVQTIQEPSDQQGAQELYEVVRQRFMEQNETSPHADHQNTDIERLIEDKKQVVFYGPPGTGKTYTAYRFAEWLRAKKDANALGVDQIRTVTFHPSFSYEDFLEGFTASVEGQQVEYDYEKGTFAEIVADAKAAYTNSETSDDVPPFFLIIDEINRGNLAQIFGETITLLEADKRLDEDNEIVTELAHSGDDFVIPPNLYVIGTMNTADESIALVDTALRRRFRFLSFPPELNEVISDYESLATADSLQAVLQDGASARDQLLAASILAIKTLNEQIIGIQHLGKGKQIGHTFLFGMTTPQDVVDTWRFEILPQLEEYYFGQFKRLENDLFENGGDGLIDWTRNEIEAFGGETLYTELCSIAGLDEDEYAPLAADASL